MRQDLQDSLEYYVRCPFGLETMLAQELQELRIKRTRPLSGGVAFFGSLREAYLACLWTRASSRVLLVLKRFSAADSNELYRGVRAIPWQEHLHAGATISVHARGMNDQLKNTQFSAVRVKDALCDALLEATGTRPNVNTEQPDIRLELALRKDKATLYLDLSGEPLHKRGYRTPGVQGEAPMKENLAAGMLMLSGWSTREHPEALYDPLCGTGTLVLEAACIAFDRAPGLLRKRWGFSSWLGHDQTLWEELTFEARRRFEARLQDVAPLLLGSDCDPRALELARGSARLLELGTYVQFEQSLLAESLATLAHVYKRTALARAGKQTAAKTPALPPTGMLLANPPYAHRLGSQADLPHLYHTLNAVLSGLPPQWTLHLITPDSMLQNALERSASHTETLYNGKIAALLHHFCLGDSSKHTICVQSPINGATVELKVWEATTEQFAQRLKKVARERKKWAKREGVTCYRIYDSDLPDYAVAIDRYEGTQDGVSRVYYCVAEYKAPKEIDETKALRRYHDALTVASAVLGVEPERIIGKLREQARGGEQYQESNAPSTPLLVSEQGHTFLTDLSSHLDTGLFLDHRTTRALISSLARGKRFLNLFAYTGSATVYAACGGAATTTTVDMSNTYLAWAEENMRLNGFCAPQSEVSKERMHRSIRADVLAWLPAERAKGSSYDLIYVDPPTFSNSKKMAEQSWSVQRDHVRLLIEAAALLASNGCIVFSCNLRSFKLDYQSLAQANLSAKDITASTIPHDFARNPKIHTCYLVTKAKSKELNTN